MKHLSSLLLGFVLISSLIVFGCSSSSETQQEKEATDAASKTTTEATKQATTQETKAKDQTEVTKEEVPPTQQTEQSSVTSNTTQQVMSKMTSGGYSVQIGAFKMSNTAEEIGSMAKNRFNVPIKTFLDKETGLTKVLVGSFGTKEEARSFRDQIAKQFSEDYKDAWVTEIPKE